MNYLDWAINDPQQRSRWREAFALLAEVLDCDSNCVLVHCRNGQDRSCFTIYAYLRLMVGMMHDTAVQFVQERVDVHGEPLFDMSRQSSDLTGWVTSSVGASTEAESGLLAWVPGNG